MLRFSNRECSAAFAADYSNSALFVPELLCSVGCYQRVYDLIKIAVDYLIYLVQCKSYPMIGDA